MKKSILKQYIKEILSFADDENEAIIDSNRLTFERLGQVMEVMIEDIDDKVYIVYNNDRVPYKKFLATTLGRLDLMAQKIEHIFKSEGDKVYVDALGTAYNGNRKYDNEAEKLLRDECSADDKYDTRICFVTADAGHGKTVLLRHFQYVTAKAYREGNSKYLFWHIDLHGRNLVLLNEAMMFEIGNLRMSGLYYNSIITLIKNDLLVLAIDGFDELGAEFGGEKVLGSMSNLVSELDGQGTIIAASRRTFFNTQDYVKRSKLIGHEISAECQFDEIKIHNWSENECVQYMEYYWSRDEAKAEYNEMQQLLGCADGHPLIERPFLFTKLFNFAYESNPSQKPSEFLKKGGGRYDSVNAVIEAFIKREVQKWNSFDKDSGTPYLNFNQHVELLMEVANEMWISQKDYIDVETIAYLTRMYLESWNIERSSWINVTRMVESHAFLVVVDGNDQCRRFDHDEFKDYFLARRLLRILDVSITSNSITSLRNFLYKSQIQESVARYLYHMIDKNKAMAYSKLLLKMVEGEWRPTYVQSNVGVILPYLLNGVNDNDNLEINGNITFTSLIFENKVLKNLHISNCSFINISFKNTILTDIVFTNCSFSDIRFWVKSNNNFSNVIIDESCTLSMVTQINDDEEEAESEYSPAGINGLLKEMHILRGKNKSIPEKTHEEQKRSQFNKLTRRFLTKFRRSTIQYEINLTGDQEYYSLPQSVIEDEVIPLLTKYEIIKEVITKNSRSRSSRAWALDKFDLQEVFQAEGNENSPLNKFWIEVNQN